MVRHREQRRADRRDHQQHALDAPWTISVEEDADGYLGSGEGQEVNRREQAKIVGTEPQFRRQRSRHDRIDGPEQIGDVIAEDEWQENARISDRFSTGSFATCLAAVSQAGADRRDGTAPSSSSIPRQVVESVKSAASTAWKPNVAASSRTAAMGKDASSTLLEA